MAQPLTERRLPWPLCCRAVRQGVEAALGQGVRTMEELEQRLLATS